MNRTIQQNAFAAKVVLVAGLCVAALSSASFDWNAFGRGVASSSGWVLLLTALAAFAVAGPSRGDL